MGAEGYVLKMPLVLLPVSLLVAASRMQQSVPLQRARMLTTVFFCRAATYSSVFTLAALM